METILRSKCSMDETCLRVCREVAECRSKDPSTKVGALVYDPISGAMHIGYNGFPAGFPDWESFWTNRETKMEGEAWFTSKYRFVIHAEANAIRKALLATSGDLSRCTLYCTHYPCHCCAKDFIVSSGIKKVIYENHYTDAITQFLFDKCGVSVERFVVPGR